MKKLLRFLLYFLFLFLFIILFVFLFLFLHRNQLLTRDQSFFLNLILEFSIVGWTNSIVFYQVQKSIVI